MTAQGTNSGMTTYYTIGSANYFAGTVGLLNSLRLLGHRDELAVLDDGFTERQRTALSPHVQLVPSPGAEVTNSTLYKPFPFLLRPTGTVVIVDSDVILNRSLDPILERAAAGEVVAYPDPEHDRWFAEWQEVFDLPMPPRRQPYVCAHFIAFSVEHWPELLGRWWSASQRVYSHATIAEGVTSAGNPTAQADQDALNAILMTHVPREALALLPAEERPHSPVLRRVTVTDSRTLACEYGGHRVTMLHADGGPKPWQPGAWVRVRLDAYSRLLRRLLHSSDVTLPWPPGEPLVPWLAPGRRGMAPLRALDLVNRVPRRRRRQIAEQMLPRPLRGPVLRLVRRS